MPARGHDFVAENDALRDENHTLRDELDAVRDENHALRDELDAVREESRVLAGKVTELEARLGQSSSNSSLPPSSDSLKSRAQRRAEQREAAKNKRSENTRARGKQPGQEGKYLEMRDDPDHVVVHDPERCDACGKDLGNAEVEAVERRQVLDTPDPTIICIEHQSVKKRCSCGVLTAGPFPPEARAPVSYGPNVRASALYLVDEQHLSVERTQDAVSSMLGVSVSSGFISSLVEEAARELEKAGFVDVLKERLLDEAVLHADETPDQVGTKTWYFHVATSKLYTYLFASTTRAKSAPDEAGVLGSFRGVMVHDRLKMYFHSDYQKAKHAICLAHITRELEGVAAVFSQEPWARGMKESSSWRRTTRVTRHERPVAPASVAAGSRTSWLVTTRSSNKGLRPIQSRSGVPATTSSASPTTWPRRLGTCAAKRPFSPGTCVCRFPTTTPSDRFAW